MRELRWGRHRVAADQEADARIRTGDPFITSEVLYQLSYVGERLEGTWAQTRKGARFVSHGPPPGMVPKRLSRLERSSDDGGRQVFIARSFRARLLGLAFLRELPRDTALFLPRCSSVHTFGMRFPLEIRFLNERGEVIRRESRVPAGRILSERGASAVLEWRSAKLRLSRRATAADSPAPPAPGPRSR